MCAPAGGCVKASKAEKTCFASTVLNVWQSLLSQHYECRMIMVNTSNQHLSTADTQSWSSLHSHNLTGTWRAPFACCTDIKWQCGIYNFIYSALAELPWVQCIVPWVMQDLFVGSAHVHLSHAWSFGLPTECSRAKEFEGECNTHVKISHLKLLIRTFQLFVCKGTGSVAIISSLSMLDMCWCRGLSQHALQPYPIAESSLGTTICVDIYCTNLSFGLTTTHQTLGSSSKTHFVSCDVVWWKGLVCFCVNANVVSSDSFCYWTEQEKTSRKVCQTIQGSSMRETHT